VKGYPLDALRGVHDERTRAARVTVADGLRALDDAERERRRRRDRLDSVERQLREDELPAAVLELRSLARAAAHRTSLQRARTEARARVAEAQVDVAAATAALEQARAGERRAVRDREAVEAHHREWRRRRERDLERAGDSALEDATASAWIAARR
jgi:hypothetical protein